ncbi:MAG: FHA domain-containing protein [Butyricicoccus sp.]|jgi:hypothetical protein|nr:FHA domain-containing protein [Clostridiales bacterium]
MTAMIVLFAVLILVLLLILLRLILREYEHSCDTFQIINIAGGVDIESGQEKELFQGFSGTDPGTMVNRHPRRGVQHLVFLEDCATRKVYRCELSNRERRCVIGRKMDSDIHVNQIGVDPDIHISRKHCRLVLCDGKVWLENLSCSGKTLLNDRILAKPEVVHTGDYISIGNVRLRVIRMEKRR